MLRQSYCFANWVQKRNISVELPMNDMDLTSAESKTIYKQIKNCVLEKYGFKVSKLYIAQTYGLDVSIIFKKMRNRKYHNVQLKRKKPFWMC